MDEQTRLHTIAELAQQLQKRRLTGAARLVLDTIEPIAFLASQLALFARPFTPRGQWRSYVDALTDEDGWKVLKQSIDEREC